MSLWSSFFVKLENTEAVRFKIRSNIFTFNSSKINKPQHFHSPAYMLFTTKELTDSGRLDKNSVFPFFLFRSQIKCPESKRNTGASQIVTSKDLNAVDGDCTPTD